MRLITPTQFAERYKVSLSTQYLWRKTSRIPFDKIGSNILYRQEIIDQMARKKELNKNAYLAIHALKK